MRRRIRSATLPLHRHALAQLAVDGVLVAVAYYLAFELRFTNGPTGYYAHLRDRTIWWVLAGSLLVLLSFRVYSAAGAIRASAITRRSCGRCWRSCC